jgi:glycosyltransferase involved in cell wall biosynthesis
MEEQIVLLHQAFEAGLGRFLPLFICEPAAGKTDRLEERGVEAFCLELRQFRWDTLFTLWRRVREHGIEVIHWNFTDPLSNLYVWCLTCLSPRLRHIYSDHHSREDASDVPHKRWKKALKGLLLKRYCQVWCVSRFVRSCLAAQATWSNLICCPQFINTERFRPDPARRAELRREENVEDRFVVALIAQLIRSKGIDLAIRALSELPENIVLWIIGTGPDLGELRDLARSIGIVDRVRFWGLQRHVEPFLQAADCFVLPSRWQEAAGLVILEAQATGLPVVASRVGGIPEYVDEGRSGLLFAPEDARQLANHVRRLSVDTQLCRRLGQNARGLAQTRFSIECRLPEILDLYRQAARGRGQF